MLRALVDCPKAIILVFFQKFVLFAVQRRILVSIAAMLRKFFSAKGLIVDRCTRLIHMNVIIIKLFILPQINK